MFNYLLSFITVYETRSYTKASQILFISQLTVTTHIQKLEKALQTILFIRNPQQGIMPTKGADLLYNRAQVILKNWSEANSELHQIGTQKTPVAIAVSHTAATTILPDMMHKIMPWLPKLDITIELQNSEHVLQMVQQHHADIGIVEKPIVGENIDRKIIGQDMLVHAGDPTSPIWLIREEGSGVYHYTQQYLKLQGITPEQRIIIENNDIIVSFLKQGIGQSIISSSQLDATIPYEILDDKFKRYFYLLSNQTKNNPIIVALLEFIWQEFSQEN